MKRTRKSSDNQKNIEHYEVLSLSVLSGTLLASSYPPYLRKGLLYLGIALILLITWIIMRYKVIDYIQ